MASSGVEMSDKCSKVICKGPGRCHGGVALAIAYVLVLTLAKRVFTDEEPSVDSVAGPSHHPEKWIGLSGTTRLLA